jgi:hypothetical protein
MRALYRIAIALMVLTPALSAAPAGAATGTTCKVVSGTATLAPGVTPTNRAQTITATLAFAGCSGTGGASASAKLVFKEKATNCVGLTKTGIKGSLSGKITWSDSEASNVGGSLTTGPKTGQVTLAGNVSSGLFAGAHLSNVIMFGQASGGGSCTAKSPLRKLTVKSVKSLVIK